MVGNRLASCVTEVTRWCAFRRLQPNADTMEGSWFGSKANLAKLKSTDCTLPVGSEMIEPLTTIRNLGVLLDSNLTMKQHVNKLAAACYCQLWRLRQIRRRVGTKVMTQLVLALVTCRLDYCNSALASLPQSTVEPLQRVQTRMIFN